MTQNPSLHRKYFCFWNAVKEDAMWIHYVEETTQGQENGKNDVWEQWDAPRVQNPVGR